jgi:hypothetical protein
MADDLATDISKTKQKIEKLERHIDTIRTGDEAAIKALRYDSRDEAKAALKDLTAGKTDLRKLLKLDQEKEARVLHASKPCSF